MGGQSSFKTRSQMRPSGGNQLVGCLAVEVGSSLELNLGVVLLQVFGGGFPVDVTERPRRLAINRADVVG